MQPYTFQEFDDGSGDIESLSPSESLPEAEESVVHEEPLSAEMQERISKLEQEAREKGYEQGHAQGHAQGYAKGMDQGKTEVAESLARLGEIIASLDKFREDKLNELSPQIIELSLEIAIKIVHKEIDLDRDVILAVADDAIHKAGEKAEFAVIRVNPLDYEAMIAHIDMLKEQSGLKNITVEPSPAISPGGCYIETPTGEIDARVEEQIKEVQDVIGTAANRKM